MLPSSSVMGGIWLAYFSSQFKGGPLLVPTDPRNTYSCDEAQPIDMDHQNEHSTPNGTGHETKK